MSEFLDVLRFFTLPKTFHQDVESRYLPFRPRSNPCWILGANFLLLPPSPHLNFHPNFQPSKGLAQRFLAATVSCCLFFLGFLNSGHKLWRCFFVRCLFVWWSLRWDLVHQSATSVIKQIWKNFCTVTFFDKQSRGQYKKHGRVGFVVC